MAIGKFFSGIKASVVLTGLFVLLVIAASTPAYREIFHANHLSLARIGAVFIVLVLLGMFLGWYFPTKVKKFCSPIVITLSLALSLGFLLQAGFLFLVSGHLSTPREIKLADCSGTVVNIHLKAPNGRYCVLGLNSSGVGHMASGSYVSSYKFTGHLRITTDKSQTTEIPLNSDKISAFPNELNLSVLDLQGGKDYDIEIQFNPPPPPSSSISLHWMQNPADQNK